MKIAIIAGEASGDWLAADLITAFRAYDPSLEYLVGIGGPAVRSIQCDPLFDISCLSMMGMEPLWHLPRLLKLYQQLYRYLIEWSPHVVIGIDSPDFNLKLEYKLRCYGIPTVHYVSPAIWAWRSYRIHKIKRSVNLMLTCFPFETGFYQQHQVPHHYVGHTMADRIPLQTDSFATRRTLNLPEQKTYVALLPGSRLHEIKQLAPIFLQAAQHLWKKNPNIHFLTSYLHEKDYQTYYALYQRTLPNIPIHFFIGRSHEVIAAADIVWVKSGTATLETLFYKKPMIICYRTHPITYWLAKYLVKVPYIGLPNLLANQLLVPELIQEACNADAIVTLTLEYLATPQKIIALQQTFLKLHQMLRKGASKEAVRAILTLLKI